MTLEEDDRRPIQPMVNGPQLSADGNSYSTIYQAAGSIFLNTKETVPVHSIPNEEVRAVKDAWVDTTLTGTSLKTVPSSRQSIMKTGMAVIAGPAGMGKRAAAIRALLEESEDRARRGHNSLQLQYITPDWDNKPDISLLPDSSDCGFLLDLTSEIDSWDDPVSVASGLVEYARTLFSKNSVLVVVSTSHGWPTDASSLMQVLVPSRVKPEPRQIAVSHLRDLYRRPERAQWLDRNAESENFDKMLANLISDQTSPADAAVLAFNLSSIADELGDRELVAQEFQRWESHLESIFGCKVDDDEDVEDRAILIAASFLDGASAVAVQQAAGKLLGKSGSASVMDARKSLAGRDLGARLKDLGIEVMQRRTSLESKPGLAKSVIRHIWEQRATLHEPLLAWIASITEPEKVGSSHLENIATLLVEIAIDEHDSRLINLAKGWTESEKVADHRRDLVAKILGRAADTPTIGRDVREELWDWSREKSETRAAVVALICRGSFARKYPRQALVRLRWVLQREARDSAVVLAEESIRCMSADPNLLPRTWRQVTEWLDMDENIAGKRAFLAILDPLLDHSLANALIVAAKNDQRLWDHLVRGWSMVLQDASLDEQASGVIRNWSSCIYDGNLQADKATKMLEEIFKKHLTSSAVSELVFGEAGMMEAPHVISLRKTLLQRYIPHRVSLDE